MTITAIERMKQHIRRYKALREAAHLQTNAGLRAQFLHQAGNALARAKHYRGRIGVTAAPVLALTPLTHRGNRLTRSPKMPTVAIRLAIDDTKFLIKSLGKDKPEIQSTLSAALAATEKWMAAHPVKEKKAVAKKEKAAVKVDASKLSKKVAARKKAKAVDEDEDEGNGLVSGVSLKELAGQVMKAMHAKAK
jgi:hypothetical protein